MIVPGAEPGDEQLAVSAAAGDDSAFETIVRRYQQRVFRLACRLTGETDAPDVLQETFLQVHRHLATFRADARFSTWLYRVATNACLMHLRGRARRPSEPLDQYMPAFDARGVHTATPEELRAGLDIEERIDRRLLAERARAAVERLPDLYREAFVLRDLEELPTMEVAEVLGIEAATVRQRVHRARLMLRGYLSELAGVKS